MGDVLPLMPGRKRMALIAHDNCRGEMLERARFNRGTPAGHELYATGTTRGPLASELDLQPLAERSARRRPGLGAAISHGRIDVLIFFWDPLEPQPHDVDVKALLRIAVVCDVPTACNRATADFVLSSRLTDEEYQRSSARERGLINRYLVQIGASGWGCRTAGRGESGTGRQTPQIAWRNATA